MSPIIYTRHRCAPAEDPEVAAMSRADLEGATWQCPECDAYWEPAVHKAGDGTVLRVTWKCTGRPKEHAHIREVEAALDDAATAIVPTVTPDMVQLVFDTYSDHMSTLPSGDTDVLGTCRECGAGIFYRQTVQAHAREMAANALQDALDKAGRDAQE